MVGFVTDLAPNGAWGCFARDLAQSSGGEQSRGIALYPTGLLDVAGGVQITLWGIKIIITNLISLLGEVFY